MSSGIVSGITNKPISTVDNHEILGNKDNKFYNLFMSKYGDDLIAELAVSYNGHIDLGRINNIDEAKTVINSGENSKIAQNNPNLPKFLNINITV